MMTNQDREEMKLLIQETLVQVLKTHHDHEDLRSMIRETLAEFLRPDATPPLPSNIVQALPPLVTDDQRARHAALELREKNLVKNNLRRQQRQVAA
jgi:hypothetical protein